MDDDDFEDLGLFEGDDDDYKDLVFVDEADAPEFGCYEGQCQACDLYGPMDDVGLCEACAPMLERDMIRQRHWDYSALAFGVPAEKREELRKSVIKKYGENLELIAPDPASSKRHRRRPKHRSGPPRHRKHRARGHRRG